MTTSTATAPPDLRPGDAAGVLAKARERRRAADAAEADLLELAVDWVLMHPADVGDDPELGHWPATYLAAGGETDLGLAGEGTPSIAEYAVAEFAAAVGLSTEAGKRFLGEALELSYRLPRLHRQVVSGALPAWKARLVARETTGLTREAVAYVDRHVAAAARKVKQAQLDRLVNEAIGRFMPDEVQRLAEASWDKRHVTIHDQLVSFTGTMHVDAELDIADALDFEAAVSAGAQARAELGSVEPLDVRRAQAVGDLARRQVSLELNADIRAEQDKSPAPRPKSRQVVLYVHLSEAAVTGGDPVARLERGESLVTVDQVKAWCGNPDAQIVVKPVIDPDSCVSSVSDVANDHIREQVALRDRTCVFPWCTRPARGCRPHDPGDHGCDDDHIVPRGRGGPTCSCNLAPLCRRHHRLKTHSPWRYVALDPGTFLWTSPHGYQFLRDSTGTLDVSRDRPRLRAAESVP